LNVTLNFPSETPPPTMWPVIKILLILLITCWVWSDTNCCHISHYTPCLKKNVPPLACFDTREWILIFFGRNV